MKTNRTPFLLSALLALSVSGCMDQMHRDIPRGPWKAESKRHSYFDTLPTSASGGELKKLRALVGQATLKTPVYARLMLNEPESVHGRMNARLRAVRAQLIKLGVAPHRIETRFLDPASAATQSASQRGLLTVIVDQYEVIPPSCPGWREYMDGWTPSEGEAHFGCTTEKNFVTMIAEPKDVFEAQSLDKADGARSAHQIERYRTGKTTQLRIEKAESGEKATLEVQAK